MLRPTGTNISIITNFGCDCNCWYCIWKNHPLKDVHMSTDWENLTHFLHTFKYLGKVSISGGGDPLYDFSEHTDWWNDIFSITKLLGMLVDVHTRKRIDDNNFWYKINKCVVSSDYPECDYNYLKYLTKYTKVRVTHVVTRQTTDEKIDEYLKIQKDLSCQFSIKQLVGYDDGGRYEEIKGKYPQVFYIDDGDYNIYYMPSNTIQHTFLDSNLCNRINESLPKAIIIGGTHAH